MKLLSVNVEQIVKMSTADRDYFYGNIEKLSMKLSFRAKLGKLILTSKRLVFLRRKGLRGYFRGKKYKDIKDIEKDLKKKDSFAIPLNEITRLNTGRKYMTSYLIIYRWVEGEEKPYLFVSTTYDTYAEAYFSEDMSEWVKAINSIKKTLNSS